MKKKYVPIITLTLALLLVGSIAYASEKRKKARLDSSEPPELSEETLRVELLAESDDQQKSAPKTKAASLKKVADVLSASKGSGKSRQ